MQLWPAETTSRPPGDLSGLTELTRRWRPLTGATHARSPAGVGTQLADEPLDDDFDVLEPLDEVDPLGDVDPLDELDEPLVDEAGALSLLAPLPVLFAPLPARESVR